MGSCLVEVHHIRTEYPLELFLAGDQYMVEAFLPDAPHIAFADRIGSGCSVFRHHHPGFLHLVTKQPTYIPEHDLSARNQIVEAQQEADERLRRRYRQAPPPSGARFLLEGSKRRPRHERFVA
jgi:hypothetical protein